MSDREHGRRLLRPNLVFEVEICLRGLASPVVATVDSSARNLFQLLLFSPSEVREQLDHAALLTALVAARERMETGTDALLVRVSEAEVSRAEQESGRAHLAARLNATVAVLEALAEVMADTTKARERSFVADSTNSEVSPPSGVPEMFPDLSFEIVERLKAPTLRNELYCDEKLRLKLVNASVNALVGMWDDEMLTRELVTAMGSIVSASARRAGQVLVGSIQDLVSGPLSDLPDVRLQLRRVVKSVTYHSHSAVGRVLQDYSQEEIREREHTGY